ncbi:NAD-dependent epimerase/dehydratase family protein [Alteromonas sediminis]|uniref:NAD-dependent epimerase/dehydratase family protein n=1 Tax=Alteromonas sediminis TaxID=2259342 RepID=A0A3N5Y095_9ALTE|nr:NAD-dependent epimerase/dehydratase family protein [Alteromonas sediminis]RPJ66263.1 NAD-dependent epimerase/dehydratase family protein [Alteromonas sediminis]
MPNSVLLCGCGWLNTQLIHPLHSLGVKVLATSRDTQKLQRLSDQGVQSAFFELGQPFPFSKVPVNHDTTIVLSIPPGRRNPDTTMFEAGIRMLIAQFSARQPAHIIFISTSAVYGDKANQEIFEHSPLAPNTASAHTHVALEHTVTESFPHNHTILRLAGLVGPARHPATSLAGKQLTAPNRVVNLVHSEDVVVALLRLIKQGPQNQAMHLCASDHPQRKAYYTEAAQRMGLPLPTFEGDDDVFEDTGKKINASATLRALGMTLAYPSPYDMIPLTN